LPKSKPSPRNWCETSGIKNRFGLFHKRLVVGNGGNANPHGRKFAR